VSHTALDAGYVIRVSIGNIQTTAADIHALWELLNDTAVACHDRMSAVGEETA
jgi:hypothetical protein